MELSQPVYALIDCNAFYVSCERLFNPLLRQRAVVVLSNNDGCVVARSPEAKAIPIAMGVPLFQIKDHVTQGRLVALSSNYTLYGDISHRVMSTLEQYGRAQEVYSIDECFLNLAGDPHPDITMHQARHQVGHDIGIPVSIGIGPTKTLAKLASDLAKKLPTGVYNCPLPGPALATLLERVPVGDVWGVGARIAETLHTWGIRTALDLARLDRGIMQNKYGVTGARIIEELRGQPCHALETAPPAKQSITVSRSFGTIVTQQADVRSAIANFIERAAEKARAQHRCASSLLLFVAGNRFDQRAAHCDATHTITFPVPTNVTSELLTAADRCMPTLLKANGRWKQAGVTLLGLLDQSTQQQSFLDPINRPRAQALMTAVDGINAKHGRASIRPGSTTLSSRWQPLANRCSPRYTTNWDEVPRVY